MAYWRERLPLRLWKLVIEHGVLIISVSRSMPLNARYWHRIARIWPGGGSKHKSGCPGHRA